MSGLVSQCEKRGQKRPCGNEEDAARRPFVLRRRSGRPRTDEADGGLRGRLQVIELFQLEVIGSPSASPKSDAVHMMGRSLPVVSWMFAVLVE